jgi:transcriptional regulator with XRE-family HTH domain
VVDEVRAMEFGKAIKALRMTKSMGLRELARAAKISSTYLSYIEQGKHGPPSTDKVKRLAIALGENPDRLLSVAGLVDPAVAEWVQARQETIGPIARTEQAPGEESPGLSAAYFLIGAAYSFIQMERPKGRADARTPDRSHIDPDISPADVYEQFKHMIHFEKPEAQAEYAVFLKEICRLWIADLKTLNARGKDR